MKTISIKELHAATGKWVRAAKRETITVTDHGEKVAVLKPHSEEAKPRAVFKGRDWSTLPSSPVDSTIYISEDRDGR